MTGTGSDHSVTPLFLTGTSWALPETGSSAKNGDWLEFVCSHQLVDRMQDTFRARFWERQFG